MIEGYPARPITFLTLLGERRGVEASKTLGGRDQFLATLLRLGDLLRQLIARLHADAILGGPLLVEHMLAQFDPAFSWRPPAGSC